MKAELTTAQIQLLLALLELSERAPWVSRDRLADELGHEGRGRAAVSASLNRLESMDPPLVRIAVDRTGPVVALTSRGRTVAADHSPHDLAPVRFVWSKSDPAELESLRVGEVTISVRGPELLVRGPGDLVALVRSRRLGFFRGRRQVMEVLPTLGRSQEGILELRYPKGLEGRPAVYQDGGVVAYWAGGAVTVLGHIGFALWRALWWLPDRLSARRRALRHLRAGNP